LDRHGAHRRVARRLADRLGIAGIGLVALDEGLDVGRRDQPHLVAERAQGAAPVVRRATGFHGDQRGWGGAEELDQPVALQSLAIQHPPAGVFGVPLEDGLGDVEADYGRGHGGRLPLLVGVALAILAHRCRRGAVHPAWSGVSRPPTHWRLYRVRGGPSDWGWVAGTRPAMTERERLRRSPGLIHRETRLR